MISAGFVIRALAIAILQPEAHAVDRAHEAVLGIEVGAKIRSPRANGSPDAVATLDLAQFGVEPVAKPVAQEIDRQHGKQDGDAGKERDPPRTDDQLPAVGNQQTPGRGRARHPRCQES